ncbi:hypothetical protein IIY59_00650 [Candidatus Saccharibacteria bacterium]|nr:hypothetical protein [Candidatus Saccharibacteria bacterium]
MYQDYISRSVKRGIRYKRKKGEWCGKAPRGYRNIHDNYDHYKPKIVRDSEYFDRVKKGFLLMLLGQYTIPEIGKIVKLDASFLRRAFRNPFYAGLNRDVDNPKITYRGTWEPMITEDEFNRIQLLLAPKKKLNGKTS